MRRNVIPTLLFIFVLLLSVLLPGRAMVARAAPAEPDAVVAWNAIAQRAVIQVGGRSPADAFIHLAYVQAAVYDAVVAIEGRYAPYALDLGDRAGASVDAAVAAAAHGVLLHYFPAQQAALDADLAAALAAIPDGPAKTEGIAVGQEAAAGIIALRQGDGLGADIGFVMPPPGPGVWQLPPGQAPLTPWAAKMTPFTLDRPDQFRSGPPPALDVQAVGGCLQRSCGDWPQQQHRPHRRADRHRPVLVHESPGAIQYRLRPDHGGLGPGRRASCPALRDGQCDRRRCADRLLGCQVHPPLLAAVLGHPTRGDRRQLEHDRRSRLDGAAAGAAASGIPVGARLRDHGPGARDSRTSCTPSKSASP